MFFGKIFLFYVLIQNLSLQELFSFRVAFLYEIYTFSGIV